MTRRKRWSEGEFAPGDGPSIAEVTSPTQSGVEPMQSAAFIGFGGNMGARLGAAMD